MLFKLFMKECSQTVKSLTYWLMVIIMVLFFASQMGQMDMEKAPEKAWRIMASSRARIRISL